MPYALYEGGIIMERIIDIFGHYANYDDYYHVDDSWIGRALLHDDNTFDGIAESYDGEEEYLLVGNIGKGFINAYVTGGINKFPRLYKGIEEVKEKYYGSCYATDGFLDLAIGEVKLTVMNADKTREVTDNEIANINKGIELLKTKLTDDQRKFYEEIVKVNYGTERKVK